MAERHSQKRAVAFKVESELAMLLDRLPNKSEFIRQAILASFSSACPLCNGEGAVSATIAEHYKPILKDYRFFECRTCGAREEFVDVESFQEDQLPENWLGFFKTGDFYCSNCQPVQSRPKSRDD